MFVSFTLTSLTWTFTVFPQRHSTMETVNHCRSDVPPIPLSLRSHTCRAPRERSNFDLSVPQIKVMWRPCCQTGWPIFSLRGMFSFSLFVADSLFLSGFPSLCLLLWFSSLFFLLYLSSLFLGQVGADDYLPESACGQLSTCAHQWVVGYVNPVLGTCCSGCCQCPAFAQNLPPDGGGGGYAEGKLADFGLLCVLCCSSVQTPGHKPVLVCGFIFLFCTKLKG